MLSFRKNHDDPNSLSDNYIESLAEDGQGRIWVGTMGGGINVIDRQRRLVTRIIALGSTDIRDIVPSRTGDTLWFATGNGIYVLETSEGNGEQSGRLIPTADLSPQRVPVLAPDRTPLGDAVNGLVLDGDEIWFSTRGSGVGRFNRGNGETTWYHKEAGSLENDSFNTIFRDQAGVLWLGSQERGLVKVLKSPAGVHFQYYDTENSGLAANDVMTIADAGDGLLWLGTWGGGLALFNKEKGRAELYRYQRDDQYSIAIGVAQERSVVGFRVRPGRMVGQEKQSAWCLPGKKKGHYVLNSWPATCRLILFYRPAFQSYAMLQKEPKPWSGCGSRISQPLTNNSWCRRCRLHEPDRRAGNHDIQGGRPAGGRCDGNFACRKDPLEDGFHIIAR
jgi:ligand-binding sensor domain-containing protein